MSRNPAPQQVRDGTLRTAAFEHNKKTLFESAFSPASNGSAVVMDIYFQRLRLWSTSKVTQHPDAHARLLSNADPVFRDAGMDMNRFIIRETCLQTTMFHTETLKLTKIILSISSVCKDSSQLNLSPAVWDWCLGSIRKQYTDLDYL